MWRVFRILHAILREGLAGMDFIEKHTSDSTGGGVCEAMGSMTYRELTSAARTLRKLPCGSGRQRAMAPCTRVKHHSHGVENCSSIINPAWLQVM
jgi:hypothetical protein